MPQHIDYEEENARRNWWLNNTGGAARDGLTVRDYFAAKMLAAKMLAAIADNYEPENEPEFWEGVAEVAYAAADAMMKERAK